MGYSQNSLFTPFVEANSNSLLPIIDPKIIFNISIESNVRVRHILDFIPTYCRHSGYMFASRLLDV